MLSVAFSPDGQVLASASTVRLWNSHTGHCLKTLHGHTSWVWAIAFHPNGKQLASASYDHTVKLWEVATGDCLQTLKEHTSSVLSVAFSPDIQWLATGGDDRTVKLWNVATGQCIRTFEEQYQLGSIATIQCRWRSVDQQQCRQNDPPLEWCRR